MSNRTYTGFGQCRLCGSFLDSQLEHGDTCSTAEATRGHYACVHAVLGRSAALDVCVASSNAAARGDAAQAAFDRQTSRNCREIPDLRAQGIVYRSSVWIADGGHTQSSPEPCRTVPERTANVSKSLPAHRVETRRAAMTRAVLLDTSARERWLLAGLIDHQLDGGDDEGADTRTDTTAPDDDNDDVSSFTSQQTTAMQASNL